MKTVEDYLDRLEEKGVLGVLFGIFKLALIVTLTACYFDASARINALHTRVNDLAVRLEATAAKGRDILVVGQLDLDAVLAAHDKRRDAKGAGTVVLDDKHDAAERRGVVHDKPDAGQKPPTEAVGGLVADPKGGDGGEDEREDVKGVHGGNYTK